MKSAYNELEYALAYSDKLPVDDNDVVLHYLIAVFFSLTPGVTQECILVKKRFDNTWYFGPFLDMSESPLFDSSYSALSAVSSGMFLDIFGKKDSIESKLSIKWTNLRAGNLSDSALNTYVFNAFSNVNLEFPCEESLRLTNRLIERARFLDTKFN